MGMVDSIQAFIMDEDIDGEELENFIGRSLQKALKRAKVGDPAQVLESVLEQRDLMLAKQEQMSGDASADSNVCVGDYSFDEATDNLGSGRFGFVFHCRNSKTQEQYAVKRIEKLCFEAEGGKKEIDVLLHAQSSDDGGHRNVIRYFGQLADHHSVFIIMALADETLEERMQRTGLESAADRHSVVKQLCEGLAYLHTLPEAITHRDLKPSNLLFKGDCLKIADMGQSRILAMGQTAVPTGSQGGTMGWMSPEEIAWDNGGSLSASQFRAHLSGDIHSAGSIIFYILSRGAHCFGPNALRQQVNIADGAPDFAALRCDVVAVDLVARMVCLAAPTRLTIEQVLMHPFFWSDTQRIEKIRGWKTSWRRGPDLNRRLNQHPRTVRSIVGAEGEGGWLSKLDPVVAARLQAWQHSFDGSDPLELVRAIRNVFEHWFERHGWDQTAEAERLQAVGVLTRWSEGREMKRGHASSEGQEMRVAAVAGYFVRERFPGLLLVFEFPKEVIM